MEVYNVFERHESESSNMHEVEYSALHNVNSHDMCLNQVLGN